MAEELGISTKEISKCYKSKYSTLFCIALSQRGSQQRFPSTAPTAGLRKVTERDLWLFLREKIILSEISQGSTSKKREIHHWDCFSLLVLKQAKADF